MIRPGPIPIVSFDRPRYFSLGIVFSRSVLKLCTFGFVFLGCWLLASLYAHKVGQVMDDMDDSEDFEILVGVRQGCVLSKAVPTKGSELRRPQTLKP